MLLSIADLVVLALATWQAVEIYRHSKLEWLGDLRSRLELPTENRFWLFIQGLNDCGWCLSVWVAFGALTAGSLALFLQHPPPPSWAGAYPIAWQILSSALTACGAVLQIFVCGLAVSRLANLGNDMFHRYCRTPGCNGVDPPAR